MTRLRSLQEHLNRWMLAYVSLAMAGGLAIGYPAASTAKSAAAAIGGLTSVAVFFIVYPMMVNVRFEALARAGRNLRAVGLALALNFLWAPLFGWLLASVFISDPLLALGFMLVMVVPCSSMAIGYTGLAKGDRGPRRGPLPGPRRRLGDRVRQHAARRSLRGRLAALRESLDSAAPTGAGLDDCGRRRRNGQRRPRDDLGEPCAASAVRPASGRGRCGLDDREGRGDRGIGAAAVGLTTRRHGGERGLGRSDRARSAATPSVRISAQGRWTARVSRTAFWSPIGCCRAMSAIR